VEVITMEETKNTVHLVDNSTPYQRVMSEIDTLRFLLGLMNNKVQAMDDGEKEVVKSFLKKIIEEM
jgi:hypothetical protein